MIFLISFHRMNADGQSMTLNLRKRKVADGTKSPSYPGEWLSFVVFYIDTHSFLFQSPFFLYKLVLIFHDQVARRREDQTEDVVRIFQRCSQAFLNWNSNRNSRKRLVRGIIRHR